MEHPLCHLKPNDIYYSTVFLQAQISSQLNILDSRFGGGLIVHNRNLTMRAKVQEIHSSQWHQCEMGPPFHHVGVL